MIILDISVKYFGSRLHMIFHSYLDMMFGNFPDMKCCIHPYSRLCNYPCNSIRILLYRCTRNFYDSFLCSRCHNCVRIHDRNLSNCCIR